MQFYSICTIKLYYIGKRNWINQASLLSLSQNITVINIAPNAVLSTWSSVINFCKWLFKNFSLNILIIKYVKVFSTWLSRHLWTNNVHCNNYVFAKGRRSILSPPFRCAKHREVSIKNSYATISIVQPSWPKSAKLAGTAIRVGKCLMVHRTASVVYIRAQSLHSHPWIARDSYLLLKKTARKNFPKSFTPIPRWRKRQDNP